ncbi:signal transduction histidine kinase [Promicromonospora sp. AC04]|uniref:sensor histidine kinase n=1 Tax=Promicromonospora sp. AC04 TaxID=2135723 RepID=UPI000D3B0A8A|nr:histidine kinase [Promicromonospora sp. AC04]PUB23933.1 signal transduction histidine kinase [Promicromonospora sp. AC04]
MGKLRLVDVGVAAALTALTLLTLQFLPAPAGVRPVDGLAYTLATIAAVGTVFRTRWPVLTLGVVTAATVTYLLLAYPYGPAMVCLVVAVYSLARRRPLRPALLYGAATLALLLIHVFTHPAALPLPVALVPASAIVAVPFSIGIARRMWHEARAAERTAAEQQARDDERLQLAHEVHDVVGHGLAAIQMQADIALHLGTPDDATTALEAISKAANEALTELRTTLAEIRPGSGRGAGPERAPTAGLANLEVLAQRVRSAGVSVDLAVTGTPRPLPDAVDLAAYRVLQESLTNVVKHGAGSAARVEVAYEPDAVRLAVRNPRTADGAFVAGFGITGMRHRVESLGGRLDAGPVDESFEVRAALPAGGVA